LNVVYNNRAEIYFMQGQLALALADYQKSDSIKPDYHYTLAGLAITQQALGSIDEALRLWKALLDKNEKYRDLAWVQKELNWTAPLVEEARKLVARL
jgi:tetratricopeptide (TPR) repeat protein